MAGNKVFNENNIRLNVKLDSKEDAIRAAGGVLIENGYVQPEYLEDMLKREEAACIILAIMSEFRTVSASQRRGSSPPGSHCCKFRTEWTMTVRLLM